MKHQHALAVLIAASSLIIGALFAFVPVFEEDFEIDSGWQMFEEIVGGNPCYGSGIGSVTRSTDVAYSGSYSLKVWANQTRSTKSNHLIAYKKYSSQGQRGTWRYQVHGYIPSATVSSGQTGPEFSIQNTRQIAPNIFRTTTAGIQYVANPASGYGDWQVWSEKSPGVADWYTFAVQSLTHSVWYTLTFEADFDNNVYKSFSIQGGGLDSTTDLSTFHIAQEPKFTDEAFVITLEDENLWNNCGTAGVYDYIVYYDHVTLAKQIEPIFLPLILR